MGMSQVKNPTSRRFGAYAIDMALFFGIAFIADEFGDPNSSAVFLLGVMAVYFLFRDIAGASLGKLILGLRVVGSPGARVVRNITVAAGPSLLASGRTGLAGTVANLIFFAECLSLLLRGYRFGDRLAGTVVVIARSQTK
jgi:uncharacterized RDD family membrane protein YckC